MASAACAFAMPSVTGGASFYEGRRLNTGIISASAWCFRGRRCA